MFIDAIKIEIVLKNKTKKLLDPTCSKAPRITIPEIALVTAIKGV
jgi:hypothetical protein